MRFGFEGGPLGIEGEPREGQLVSGHSDAGDDAHGAGGLAGAADGGSGQTSDPTEASG